MARKRCDECGKEMFAKANACPHCGAVTGSAPYRPWAILVIVALGVAFVTYGVVRMLR